MPQANTFFQMEDQIFVKAIFLVMMSTKIMMQY